MRTLLTLAALFVADGTLIAQPAKKKAPAQTVEQIAERARPSVVVIVSGARDGKKTALGTGVVVGEGLIATNYHVIGEARPIEVQLADGSRHEVSSVHASDRNLDLAVIRIAKNDLKPLPLGDAKKLKSGQPIVVLGHPHKLEFSVVAGVLSGQREVDGINMLQLAIPIEPGNSGGPVLDMAGNVIGIVTMKSLVTANLGFAMPVGSLKPLLDRPNPIPMERWLTIGQLDKNEWKTLLGGRWRQRAGRILIDGTGSGFGGRTLCLRVLPAPVKLPVEAAVSVKLDDEKGAAGLIFGGDDSDRHYGFYPTGGKLRLTRFDGADVFSWKILRDFASPHYRPGEWNLIKVRIEKDKITCYCNEEVVAELADPDYAGNNVGLVRFRQTVAEFKNFQLAARIPSGRLPDGDLARLKKTIAALPLDRPVEARQLEPLVKLPPQAGAALRDQAKQLEKQAEQLRKLAQAVHQQRTLNELAETLKTGDKADLGRAALLVARLDNEDLDVDDYLRQLDRMAREASAGLPKNAGEKQRLEALNNYLFKERGFHGSRGDYYSRSNSYLNEVLDDREGIPITLAVLYMEVGRRLDLRIVGLGLPGHFMVRHDPAKGEGQIVDVFEGGKFLSMKEVEELAVKSTGRALDKKVLEPATKKAIIVRMLRNLLNVADDEMDRDGLLRYLDGILAVAADSHEERWMRAVLRFQAGQHQGARADVDAVLEAAPPGIDLDRVRELRDILEKK